MSARAELSEGKGIPFLEKLYCANRQKRIFWVIYKPLFPLDIRKNSSEVAKGFQKLL